MVVERKLITIFINISAWIIQLGLQFWDLEVDSKASHSFDDQNCKFDHEEPNDFLLSNKGFSNLLGDLKMSFQNFAVPSSNFLKSWLSTHDLIYVGRKFHEKWSDNIIEYIEENRSQYSKQGDSE